MSPEAKAREEIDKKLIMSGWVIQDMKELNLTAGIGVAVREFPTSTGPVDYALFVEGTPDADKQRTARDVICFLYKINPLHIKAHLQDKENAVEIIETWCEAISV